MHSIDFTGRVALITGGTRGLGHAAALALGARGARCVLTHRWGSVGDEEIAAQFAAVDAPAPLVIEADAALDEDTAALMQALERQGAFPDIFINNVCVTRRGGSLDSLRRRDLVSSLRYSAWPLRAYVEQIEQTFGRPPGVIIASSSDGCDHHYPAYDYVAASKAALEALTKSMAKRLAGRSRVFVLRCRQVGTQGYAEMFPRASQEMLAEAFAPFQIAPDAIGKAVVALCSGMLDGLHGQVLNIDKGAAFMDNILTAGPLLMEAGR